MLFEHEPAKLNHSKTLVQQTHIKDDMALKQLSVIPY